MKRSYVLWVLGLLLMYIGRPSYAQATIDPRFPEIGKSTFGVTELYIPEAVLPSTTGLNPATLNLVLDLQQTRGGELDWGRFRAGKFGINFAIANAILALDKRSTLRISGYRSWSNQARVPASGPLTLEHNGEAIEFVYAQRLRPDLDIGVALVPVDHMTSTLRLGGRTIADGDARSLFQGRVGTTWRNRWATIGVVYGHEVDRTEAKVPGALLPIRGKFQVRTLTEGIAFEPRKGTTVFFNRQHFWINGEGVSQSRPISYFGLQQFLGKQWIFRYARVGTGNSFSLGYMARHWQGYVSYTNRAFSSTEDIYGKGNLVSLSLVWSK